MGSQISLDGIYEMNAYFMSFSTNDVLVTLTFNNNDNPKILTTSTRIIDNLPMIGVAYNVKYRYVDDTYVLIGMYKPITNSASGILKSIKHTEDENISLISVTQTTTNIQSVLDLDEGFFQKNTVKTKNFELMIHKNICNICEIGLNIGGSYNINYVDNLVVSISNDNIKYIEITM